MIRNAVRAILKTSLHQATKLPFSRRAMHGVSVMSRGAPIVFLRCRRVFAEESRWQDHPDFSSPTTFTAGDLHRTLEKIQKRLRFAHAGEALRALESGERLSDSHAVLTFDESFAHTWQAVRPILEDLRIPALFFVTTDPLTSGAPLWDAQLQHFLVDYAPENLALPWIDRVLMTQTADQRADAFRQIMVNLINVDENTHKERFVELMDRLPQKTAPMELDRMLRVDELKEMSRHELVSIGAHGHTHAALDAVSSDTLDNEMRTPRQILSEVCGSSFLNIVSYPFGGGAKVANEIPQKAQEVGYRAGFTAANGVARPGDHHFLLPRLALRKNTRSIDAYEMMGVFSAIDHILHMVAGTEDSVAAELEG